MTQVLFFAPDMAEVAQRRRIKGWRDAGFDVASLSFVKQGGQLDTRPDWPDTCLGKLQQERLIRRLFAVFVAIWRVWLSRDMVRSADIIIARNIDMVWLGVLARWLARSTAPLAYECLDIHGIFTGNSLKSRFCRWVERRLLRRIDLLILSSPGFYHHYFASVQEYRGQWTLLENKLWFGDQMFQRPQSERTMSRPLVLGWVGSLRCQVSFDILRRVASLLGDAVKIECHGVVHDHVLPDFCQKLDELQNVTYFGPYDYPAGLAAVYERLDMVWAQDLWQWGANSSWLLPNRIYEAGWYSCPVIAVAGTETAHKVSELGSGYVIERAKPDCLANLLMTCRPQDLGDLRQQIHALPDRAFGLDVREYHQIAKLLLKPTETSHVLRPQRS